MKRSLDIIATGLLIVLGGTHMALTPLFYGEFNISCLWFVGSGMAFLFLGFLNVTRITTSSEVNRVLSLIGNSLALVFVICFIFLEQTLAAQGAISLLVLSILLILSISKFKQPILTH